MTTSADHAGRHSVVATISAALERDVLAGHLAPGTHLKAQDIADRLQVSRFPVSAAFQNLVARGLAVHRRNQGYFVADGIVATGRVVPPKGVIEKAYAALAEDRLAGVMPDKVSKSLLRDRYGLTSAQLSDLLTRVTREGWGEQRPGYGIAFSPMLTTPQALLQTYRVRLALEPASLLEPEYSLDRESIASCRRTEEVMLFEGGIESMSLDELYTRGVRFHETIVGASNNPFFLDALRRINAVRRLLAYRAMATDRERYREQAQDHLAILDLLERRSNKAAAEFLHEHLLKVTATLEAKPSLLQPR